MPAIFQRRPWLLAAAVAATLALGACSGFTERTRGALAAVTPYKVEVVQGNFVSKEQVAALKPGMSRQQVREILGTSLLNDVFHSNRWDYVFTIRRQGVDPQERRLTVYFKDNRLERFVSDPMPADEEADALILGTNVKRVPRHPPQPLPPIPMPDVSTPGPGTQSLPGTQSPN